MNNRRSTLLSQIVSSGRAVVFTVAAAHSLGGDDFGRLSFVAVASIVAISLARAAISNPIGVLTNHLPNVLAPAAQLGLASSALVAVVVAGICVIAGVDLGISLGLLALPFVVFFDVVRVASIHLGNAHRAVKLDCCWLTVLVAGLIPLLALDIATLALLLVLWSGAALGSVAAIARHTFVVSVDELRSFIDVHRPLGQQMLAEVAMESVATRLIPAVALPVISLTIIGSYRLAETVLGVGVVLWSATALSSLREASLRFEESGGRATVTLVMRRMAVPGGFLIANALLALAIPNTLGEWMFNEAWVGGRALVVVVSVFLVAQVATSVVTVAARASNRQSTANLVAGISALIATPSAAFAVLQNSVTGLFVGLSISILIAGLVGLGQLRRKTSG